MSSLHGKLEEYLAVRRAMGFKMERHEKLLGQFAGFLAANGETVVTTENAVAWATLPAAARTRWHALRLSAVRGFAAWLNAADPAHQVPPRRLIPYGSRGRRPLPLHRRGDRGPGPGSRAAVRTAAGRHLRRRWSGCWPSRACGSARRSASTAATTTPRPAC